jgi:hypothetical protein
LTIEIPDAVARHRAPAANLPGSRIAFQRSGRGVQFDGERRRVGVRSALVEGTRRLEQDPATVVTIKFG